MTRSIRAPQKKAAARKPATRAPVRRAAPAKAKAREGDDPYAHLNEPDARPVRAAGRPEQDRIQRMPVREAAPRDDERQPRGELRRNRRRIDAADDFKIDRATIPQGTSYEWKALAHKGKAADTHQIRLRENGWRPVPAARHPELLPDKYTGSSIIRDEMILMERPQYLTDEARNEDLQIAKEQVMIKEAALSDAPDGTFSRRHASARAVTGVRVTHEPMTIPD